MPVAPKKNLTELLSATFVTSSVTGAGVSVSNKDLLCLVAYALIIQNYTKIPDRVVIELCCPITQYLGKTHRCISMQAAIVDVIRGSLSYVPQPFVHQGD